MKKGWVMTSLLPIASVLALLLFGFALGKALPPAYLRLMLKPISIVVLLLLFLMGSEFGSVFTDKSLGGDIIKRALLFALLITGFTAALLYRKSGKRAAQSGSFWTPFFGCFKAVVAFSAGVAAYCLLPKGSLEGMLSSTHVLYVLIFLVGADLVHFKLGGFSRRIFLLPIFAMAATVAAGFVFSLLAPYSFVQSLMLSAGFGWFSLSGPMVGGAVSAEMGALAFMIDFFREMLSIVFLYFFGKTQPVAAIGLSGAAAMDSALPFVKENCEPEYVKYAIVSGFILTLIAPVLISFLTTVAH